MVPLGLVNEGMISLAPAAELSYPTHDEKRRFIVTGTAAQKARPLGQMHAGRYVSVMSEEKKRELDRITIIRKYFPKSYTPM